VQLGRDDRPRVEVDRVLRLVGEVRAVDLPPESGGVGSERHAAARVPIPSMSARASAGVR
jgi:hypothetical protein